MKTYGTDSRGSKLSSSETVRLERGEVMGGAAGCLWVSIDAREWYRDTKLRIPKRAFVSPFEVMEMPVAVDDEKEAKYLIGVGSAGKSRIPRST